MKKNIFSLIIIILFLCNNSYAQEKLYSNTFPLGDVTLSESPFLHARDLNIEVLLKYNVDRLLAPYRKEAGLTPKDSSYDNWIGLDGHIAGHYLSAMAMNYASTNNLQCKERMDYIISELKDCNEANNVNNSDWGIGYLGGVPNSKLVWSTLKEGDLSEYRKSWVPWYNVHKMFAGLRDAWLYTNNEDAIILFLKFCDWAIEVTSGLTDEKMESMLDIEHGGMNEIFADAFQITGDQKYLLAAKRFSHRQILDPMSNQVDNLDNKHANTQVPKAIGFQRIAELSKDDKYFNAAEYFWHRVVYNRSLSFGGNSRRELFPSVKACSDYIDDVEGPESCNSNNMLRLTEGLFRINHIAKYIDFYERALYNHILSTQHPEHGGYVYFTPARPRHYRVYSAPNEAMWCCVGTGMENHGKYNQIIYTHIDNSLFVNLFIPSELNWKDRGVKIKQETNFPYEEQTKLIVTEGSAQFKLMIRYPVWVNDGELTIKINNQIISYSVESSSYIEINRTWKAGDIVEIILPMHIKIERLPNIPEYISFLYGPIVLSAITGNQNLEGLIADDSRWGHIAHGKRLPIDKAPIIIESDFSSLTNKLIPVENKPLAFTFSGIKMINPQNLILEPFYKIHDSRYMIYWMALSENQYKAYLDSIEVAEKEKLALQNRTIDFVATGEQQPEVDHNMKTFSSNSGVNLDELWRDAIDGGYFSYQLKTNGEVDLSLMVRYWGFEWGSRVFDIYIDDAKLISEDNTGRWYQSKFQDVVYEIPNSMVEGKENVRIKFVAVPGSTAGAVYYIRLLKNTIDN